MMKIVRVTYTTRADFVVRNCENIQKVMEELRRLNYPGIFYTACLGEDGRTFTHTAFYGSDADQKVLTGLPAFADFQAQLKASGPEIPPRQELLTLIGCSTDIL